jgi:hypothetical protein
MLPSDLKIRRIMHRGKNGGKVGSLKNGTAERKEDGQVNESLPESTANLTKILIID